MNSTFSSKIVALSAALIINAMMLGSVAILFDAHLPISSGMLATQGATVPAAATHG